MENLTGGPEKVILSDVYDVEMDAFPGKTVTGIYAPIPQFTPDGKIIVNPATGIPLADPVKSYYGDAAYDFMMGMVNTFNYKNWGLSFSLDYRRGGVMYSGTSDLLLFTGNSYATTYNDRRPFILPNSVIQTGVDGSGHLYMRRIQHRSMNCIMILTGILHQTWLNLTRIGSLTGRS